MNIFIVLPILIVSGIIGFIFLSFAPEEKEVIIIDVNETEVINQTEIIVDNNTEIDNQTEVIIVDNETGEFRHNFSQFTLLK
jgi:hypothetical protein